MENSALEAPAHRLLVVHRKHQLRPTWRGRRAARLQFHAAVGIHPGDPDGFAYRGLARRGWRHPPHIAPLLGGGVGVEPLSLLCALNIERRDNSRELSSRAVLRVGEEFTTAAR